MPVVVDDVGVAVTGGGDTAADSTDFSADTSAELVWKKIDSY